VSDIVVITFDNATDAGEAREALRDLEQSGRLSLDDAAVVVKDAQGNVDVADQLDRGVKLGAVGGGALGLLLGFMFPIAGAAVGALGGALVVRLADLGVDKGFVEDVTAALRPGTSALFLMVREGNPDAAVAALEPFRGTLHQTSFGPDVEESLRQALR
jgi:uncharacterized membrane protein